MDDLISRKRIMDEAKWLSGPMTGDGWDNWGVYALIERQPSAPAVPLDKLCVWLAKFDCPCDINEDMCDLAHGVDRCLGIFNSSAFCWQYLLTKMMEEQDAAD